MKRIVLLLLSVFTLNILFAQDIIVTKDAQKISAKISEVDVDVIKYKKFDNLDGPTYTMSKAEISSIIYENGSVDVFKDAETKPAVATTHAANQRTNGYMSGEVRFITRKIGEVAGYGWGGGGTVTTSGFFFGEGVASMNEAELARAIRENPQNMLYEPEYRAYLQTYAPEAYRKYKQGDAFGISGACLLAVGLCSIALSPLMFLPSSTLDTDQKLYGFLGMFCGGTVLSLGSIPLLSVAYHKQRVTSCDVYNENYAHKSGRPEATLNFGANRYGVGFSLRF
ncbi:MAG: hypothetical protein J6W84_01475 [Bacteroidales bacterium]|nr:hypothetical protein [Bacteroidales bacterium]